MQSIPFDDNQAEGLRPRPFVKWVGGKTRLLPKLLEHLPDNVEQLRYVEPFLGGGALFFALLPTRAVLSDLNDHLIAAYLGVTLCPGAVLGGLRVLAAAHTEDPQLTFATARVLFNDESEKPLAQRAALFIYLNKTAFNGLYRENSKGHFNAPLGAFKTPPKIVDEVTLRTASRALAHASILSCDFAETLDGTERGDFVYLDPPYVPTSKTSNFTAYTGDGFGDVEQEALEQAMRRATLRNVKVLLSQSDHDYTRRLYSDYRITTVENRRSISADGEGRGVVRELLIQNY